MTTILKSMNDATLLGYLKELVSAQKKMEIDILLSLDEVMARRLHLSAGYCSLAEYCKDVFGISHDVAWKRAMAVMAIRPFPKLLELLRGGRTHVSHLAMLSGRITQANADKIIDFLPGASKRDLQFFLERIQSDGSFADVEPTIEIKIRCPREVLDKLDHVRGLLSKANRPGAGDLGLVLEQLLDHYIEKKDPVKKAERVMAKSRHPEAKPKDLTRPGAVHVRRAIPAATRHQVLLRDGGQCTFEGSDGRRCAEKSVLHIDHIRPWALGGGHEAENLRVLCRTHNNFRGTGDAFAALVILSETSLSNHFSNVDEVYGITHNSNDEV